MPTRELKVEIVGDSRDLERALRNSSRAATGFGSAMSKMGRVVGLAALGAGAAITAGFVVTLKRGFDELSESQKVMAQTEAALKSTGAVANVTAKDIESLATQLSMLTGIDDEAIQANENLLLTFKNVRNEVGKGADIFDRATKASLDLSVAGFGALDSTAKMLGKALNDPIKGMTALGRAGVTFTAGQKETIKSLVESGNALEAQKLILKEVESQVGGSAKAYGETLPGQLAKARNAFDEIAANLAVKFLPMLTSILNWVNQNWPTISKVITGVGTAIIAVFRAIGVTVDYLRKQWEIHRETAIATWKAIQSAVQQTIAWFKANIVPPIQAIITASIELWNRFGDAIKRALQLAVTIIQTNLQNMLAPFKIFFALLRGDWSAAWEEARAMVARTMGAIVSILQQAVGLWLSAAKALGKAIFDGIVAGVKGIVERVGAQLAYLWTWLRTEGVDLAKDAAKAIGKAIFFGIIDGIKGLVSSDAIKSEIRKTIEAARNDGVPKAESGGEAIGRSLVQGITTGIALAKAAAIVAAAQAVLEVIGSMKSASESSSPSRLTERTVGRPLMEGVALGIGNSVSATSERAYEAVRTVVKKAAQAARDAKKEFQDAFRELADNALAAFDKQFADWTPPSMKKLEGMRAERREKDINREVEDARMALTKAQAEALLVPAIKLGQTPTDAQKQADESVATAQARLDEALLAQEELALEKAAVAEQKEHNKQVAAARAELVTEIKRLGSAVGKISDAAAELGEALRNAIASVGGKGGNAPGRQHGGSVKKGMAYLVGERGPELFTAPYSGNITPNSQLGGARMAGVGGMVVNVHVAGSVIAERDLAASVQDSLLRTLRMNGKLGF